MASSDATAIPVKNQAYRVTFPVLDADGDLVTAMTTPDSEISKDGGTFADCTNEATEIATASGMYFLDLTATEMNADTVAIIVKSATAGMKTTPIVLYPRESGDIKVQLEPITHTSAVIPTVTTLTGHTAQTGDNFARLGAPVGASISADVAAINTDTNDIQARLPAALVSGRIDASVGAMAANVVTAAAIADAAIDRATFADDTGMKSAHSGTAQAGAASSITLASGASSVDSFYANCWVYLTGGTGAGQARRISGYTGSTRVADTAAAWVTAPDVTTTYAVLPFDAVHVNVVGVNAISTVSFASGAINAAAIATDAIGSNELAASAVTEIAAAVAAGSVASVVGAVGSVTGAVGSVAGNVGGNVVGSVGSLGATAKADVNAEVDTALIDIHLDHLLAADYDPAAKPGVATALLNELVESDAGVSRYTANALEQAPAGGGGETQMRTGTAQAGGPSTITLDAGASAVDGYYKNQIVALTAGTGANQSGIIESYVGATKVATVSAAWATIPDATTAFTLLPLGAIPGASAPTADANAEALLDKMATEKITVDRDTGDIIAYRVDGVTPRGTRRITEINATTQGLVP